MSALIVLAVIALVITLLGKWLFIGRLLRRTLFKR